MKEILHHKTLDYVINYPDDYEEGKKFPLLIHLHGAGTRGNDISLVADTAVGPLGEINRGVKLPFIIAAPQCPGKTWFEYSETLLSLIDTLVAREDVDRSRVYLCGISMGGYACWQVATVRAELFAAVMPVCGGGMPWAAGYLKGLPVWAHHGALDGAVDVSNSIDMYKALKRIGSEAKLTIYPDCEHDCWTPAFTNPEVYRWMLRHRRDENWQVISEDALEEHAELVREAVMGELPESLSGDTRFG